MIYELQQPGKDLLAIDCPFPEALAVIQGNNPGWVFVDDTDSPRTALIWAQGLQGFYLVGEPGNTSFLEALNDHIDRALKPRLRSLGVDWFEVSGGGDWDAVIERTFERRGLERSQQWVFTQEPMKTAVVIQPVIPTSCQLVRINRGLLEDFASRGQVPLLSRLKLFWGSEAAFLKSGIGYVLVSEGEIASLCCSGFVAGDTHAIDIETVASQRRKGYAEAVASAFLAECLGRHFQPYWDCMAENVA